MIKNILFKNAKIPVGIENETETVDFLVEDGIFVEIGNSIRSVRDFKIVDFRNQLTLPGGIDPHVHFDTPGFEEREDFDSGSAFSAMGGITTVIDMPCTSIPPVTSVKNLENKLKIISGRSYTDYALWGGVSGNCFREENWQQNMNELWEAGVVGFKTYSLSGMDTFTHLLPDELEKVIEHAGKVNALIGHHAECSEIVIPLTEKIISGGRNNPEAYFSSRPEIAEVEAIKRIAKLAGKYGAAVHIVHISSGKSAAIIRKARLESVDISGETCPHFLAFTVKDFIEKGSILKTAPVVKTKKDLQKLWESLKNGSLSFVSSDHAACPIEQKQTGSIWTDYGGISGTGTVIPYLYSEGYRESKISLSKLVEITSKNAAKRFGIYPTKGAFMEGSDADFVCIDENDTTFIHGIDFPSKGKLTPFEGSGFKGKIKKTFLRGNLIYSDESGLSSGKIGRFLKRG